MELYSPPKSGLTVTLENLNTSPYSMYNRLLDTSTPAALRKSTSRATPAEVSPPANEPTFVAEVESSGLTLTHACLQRQFAFDTACQCVEESLQSKGPELQHARYFRTDG